MFCSNCGNRTIEGANFCGVCGKALTKQQQPVSEPSAQPPVIPVPAPVIEPVPMAMTEPEATQKSAYDATASSVSAMDIMSAFDNISRSIGVNVSYGENTDVKLEEMRKNTYTETSPPCEKCGMDKDTIVKKQEEQRKAVEEARASGAGMMIMGMTPARDFYKCPRCGRVICSSCAKECCPFCDEKLSDGSTIIRSKTPFVQ